jgi:hypothetical protein
MHDYLTKLIKVESSIKHFKKGYCLSSILFVLLVLLLSVGICYSLSNSDFPYIDSYSTQISYQTIHVNDTVNLDVGVYNPINESVSVVLKILVADADCFPSNESTMILPPKTYYSVLEKTKFILTPHQSGTHPFEVQLWWNGTKVDSYVSSFDVQPILEASIFMSWLRVELIFAALIYLIIAVRFVDPSFKVIMETGDSKWMIFSILSFFYWLAALALLFTDGDFISYFPTSSLGAIHLILGIGWSLGIISLGFCLFKKYVWSNRFSAFAFLYLLLSVVWDWLLFPENPFPQWSPIVILVFGAFLQVAIEALLKGVFGQFRRKPPRQ